MQRRARRVIPCVKIRAEMLGARAKFTRCVQRRADKAPDRRVLKDFALKPLGPNWKRNRKSRDLNHSDNKRKVRRRKGDNSSQYDGGLGFKCFVILLQNIEQDTRQKDHCLWNWCF